ncbi:MAG: hypothetical protein J0I48_08950 [Devosia sp.]|uniref:hypothetical protein n=1 Tax=Devosia sp. 66-22 TaxID=1895753 RepID=UPI00092AE792|nr:hypothetical protein [Devosia sp. 66-22]MBN9346315.1 hypothetical protein [Devosia sp.]OJX53876.1 MAG: hypothetical protein BGO81_15155 [Devosia sp. 66-22]
MKLTWFGGTALRVYVGGEIVVIDAETAPAVVDRGELLAGADRVLAFGDAIAVIDPTAWRPEPVGRAIDEPLATDVFRIGDSALLLAAAAEPPLVLLGPGELPRFGRWADGGVIVLLSAREALVAEVTAMLDVARPRLVALAVDEQTLDLVIEEIAEHLGGAGLVSMEPGLALEV